jgi:tetratricopeptide (TPR) repeat protein
LLSLALAGGCSTFGPSDGEPAPIESRPDHTSTTPAPTPAEPPPRPDQPSASAAYRPLLDKAEQASDRGEYEQALALLERAQRIDPDSAEIYLAMARTHHARGDHQQARAVAERGLLYCTGRSECDALRTYTR